MTSIKKRNKTKTILLILLGIFLAAQAVQPKKNKGSATGAKDITQAMPVPDNVMSVLKRSCYDCHSDHTTYPWYDNITPVNWWVANHIKEGKHELNFTVFSDYPAKKKAKKLEEIAETVEKSEMPLPSYLWTHGDAKLSEAEKSLLIDWAKSNGQSAAH